ncbi:hypothetical protein B0T11DRAFT_126671 [Plectosphaerella cucumerina]|uniref:Uncharacterized protein n=1 Tax=Plectosphaerella cucumerina TaxID=40658 RepID=A0A8K0X0S0_9PEZI|nr:hypothetical protein B0T11DRAFT_126671 [Plectosphaerella cucumerina]
MMPLFLMYFFYTLGPSPHPLPPPPPPSFWSSPAYDPTQSHSTCPRSATHCLLVASPVTPFFFARSRRLVSYIIPPLVYNIVGSWLSSSHLDDSPLNTHAHQQIQLVVATRNSPRSFTKKQLAAVATTNKQTTAYCCITTVPSKHHHHHHHQRH